MKNRFLSAAFLAAVCLSLCVPAWAAVSDAEAVSCVYDNVLDFSEGFAAVERSGKWGFLDKTGAVVVPLEYDAVNSFSESLAAVERNGKWGFIDTKGALAVPLVYDSVGSFSEGLAAVEQSWKYGYIDGTGAVVVPLKYDAVSSFSEGLAVVRRNWKYGYIDKTGAVVVPLKYDGADSFSGGLAVVQQNWKYGFISKTGAVVVPLEYEAVNSFSEGLARVKRNGKWGFIDTTGLQAVSRTYDAAYPFSEEAGHIAAIGARSGLKSDSMAYARMQAVELDGKALTLPTYALKAADGSETVYVRLRDVAYLLNGTAAAFNVVWDGAVNITTKTAYTPDGSELETPFSGDKAYQDSTADTRIDGRVVSLRGIMLTDDSGGGYTYYKLSDLGEVIGFAVDWSAEQVVIVTTMD